MSNDSERKKFIFGAAVVGDVILATELLADVWKLADGLDIQQQPEFLPLIVAFFALSGIAFIRFLEYRNSRTFQSPRTPPPAPQSLPNTEAPKPKGLRTRMGQGGDLHTPIHTKAIDNPPNVRTGKVSKKILKEAETKQGQDWRE